MTKDEIIDKLTALDIIVCIGEGYFLTEKYKDIQPAITIMSEPEENPIKKFSIVEEKEPVPSRYPEDIMSVQGKARYTAFMNLCEIPTMSPGNGYSLRDFSTEAITILNQVFNTEKVKPSNLITAVREYYTYVERPKKFKNLLESWDILEIYNLVANGGSFGTNDMDKPNEKWR